MDPVLLLPWLTFPPAVPHFGRSPHTVSAVFHPRVFCEVDAIMKYYEGVADSKLADDFYQEFRSKVLETSLFVVLDPCLRKEEAPEGHALEDDFAFECGTDCDGLRRGFNGNNHPVKRTLRPGVLAGLRLQGNL